MTPTQVLDAAEPGAVRTAIRNIITAAAESDSHGERIRNLVTPVFGASLQRLALDGGPAFHARLGECLSAVAGHLPTAIAPPVFDSSAGIPPGFDCCEVRTEAVRQFSQWLAKPEDISADDADLILAALR